VTIEPLAGPPPGQTVNRIALAPLLVAPGARRVEPDATEMVGSRLVEALAEQGELEYVAPDEVSRWLAQREVSPGSANPQQLGAELARAFGADAVLFGSVRIYSARVGGERGATRPAAVWFDLELRLPDGTRIWAGSFHEDQKSLSEDLLSLPRAAERGFEWLDASSLAAYGARELIGALAQERRGWR
jgi:hypothetical protein